MAYSTFTTRHFYGRFDLNEKESCFHIVLTYVFSTIMPSACLIEHSKHLTSNTMNTDRTINVSESRSTCANH